MDFDARRRLTLEATRKALAIRLQLNVGLDESICVYDAVDRLGIDTHFVKLPSLEGMYQRGRPPKILISADRPTGRQTFTCAHELGHFVFNHGARLVDLVGQPEDSSQEFIANAFAAALLMPKSTVVHGFASCAWQLEKLDGVQVYTIAGWLGVGYSALVNHMLHTLSLLSSSHASRLLTLHPKAIRAQVLGQHITENVYVVDEFWTGRAIDIEVGDLIRVPTKISWAGRSAEQLYETHQYRFFRGIRPGLGRLYNMVSGWASYVRVSRRQFVGRSIYRHLEDPEHDEPVAED